ncbi:hypothetical protein [Paramagnetospirillum kuznetsovii]|nr:hypothetical protein [Paramagnetospirillum kuznetsovii]
MTKLRPLLLLPLMALAACNGAAQTGGGPAVESPSQRTETAALPRVQSGPLTPEGLKGLSAAQVEDALGTPGFRRRDPPAEIWQYRVKSCTLDLFLYVETAGRMVAHYAVRSPVGSPVSDRACLDEVLNAKTERPVS